MTCWNPDTPVTGSGAVLVACSHGTASAAGRGSIGRLALAVAAARPGLEVRQAFVDVPSPSLTRVIGRLSAQGRSSVIVPLLLSTGFHVRVDIRGAVEAGTGLVRAAGPLGVGGVFAPLLARRLAEIGASKGDAVVVAAAGSSDPGAAADLAALTTRLAATRSGVVVGAYVNPQKSPLPAVTDAVADLRAAGARRVVIASYLLAPGRFQTRLGAGGADLVTEPLGIDPLIVGRVLTGYDEVVTADSTSARPTWASVPATD